MNIFVLSSTCSQKKYNEIFEERNRKFIDPSQKFFLLLLKGIAECDGISLECISLMPVSGNCHKKRMWNKELDEDANIKFLYPGFINIGIFRLLSGLITEIFMLIKEIRRSKDNKKYIIFDSTNFLYTLTAVIAGKLMGVKTINLITDIPSLSTAIGHKKEKSLKRILQLFYDTFADGLLKYSDAYILLTEQMSHRVNVKRRPYIVIEGSVDSLMKAGANIHKNKDVPKSIIYAGGIHEKFGIIKLVDAFDKVKMTDWQLKIYGAGQVAGYIEQRGMENSKIKYMGVVSVEEIVNQEMKATLLVNPRPTNETFTEYSFPSKTLEYMVSGTPLLTTRLPGIPEEYFSYVYLWDNETEEGMYKTLKKVMEYRDAELEEQGKKAQKFVLEQKNNIVQGKKIVDFIKSIGEKDDSN